MDHSVNVRELDQAPRSAVSDLALLCLPMLHKTVIWLIRVKTCQISFACSAN